MTGGRGAVLVTGSSGSIGSFLVEAFLDDGFSVVGLDVAPQTRGSGPVSGATFPSDRFRFIECDVSDPALVKQALAGAQEPRRFDVVINNAGLIYNSPLVSFQGGKLCVHDFDAWRNVLASTLNSAFLVSAHCVRQMIEAGKPGVIINISSICAAGNAGQAAYSAAKAGVNSMTVTLAKELGPLGIRVAAIAPGYLDTASTRNAMPAEAISRIRKSIPLKRLGTPRQLYHAVKFVIENDYFHGKILELDGGLTL